MVLSTQYCERDGQSIVHCHCLAIKRRAESRFNVSYRDEESLIYALSTSLFDHNDDYENAEVPEEMKRLFPKLWEQALEAYLNHEHDT